MTTAAIVSALAAVAAAVIAGLSYRQTKQSSAATPESYKDQLAELVVKEVGSEIDLLGLAGSDYIEVDWTFNPRFSTAETRQKFIGDGHDPKATTPRDLSTLAEDWRKHRPQLAVVLGDKGAGKSTAAMLLIHQLLEGHTDREDAGPVPVLFRIGEWNPDYDLQAWIEDELVKHYGLPKARDDRELSIAGRLLAGGHLVLVLDGFDEIAASHSQGALRALRQTLTTLPCPVVLTSRIGQFTEAMGVFGDRLGVTAAVTLRPITPKKAELFLKSGHQDEGHWDVVIEQLWKDGSPIAQALTTPLMVFLCREAYKSKDDQPDLAKLAQCKDRDAVEHELISRFIPSRYAHGGATASGHEYDSVDVTRWLKFIAIHMNRIQTSQFEWWRLAETIPRHEQEQVDLPLRLNFSRRKALSGLVFGLALGLIFGLVGGLQFGLQFGLTLGLSFGLAVSLTSGLVADLIGIHTLSQLRTLTARQVLCSARNAMIGTALVFGLTVGLASGLVSGLASGLVAGLDGGLAFELMAKLEAGLAFGLVIGSAFGLMFVLTSAIPRSSWSRYRLSHFRLAWRRESKLPWHLMDFLEDSHRLGVLRRTGAAYEFRHGVLQRFLVDTPATSDEKTPPTLKA